MHFADLALSKRLERAEGYACTRYAEARRNLYPQSAATWIEVAGALASFNGVGSPVTQSFALGLAEPLDTDTLDIVENFFHSRGASAQHEVSPFAGPAALDLLCKRAYTPIEISNVLCRSIDDFANPVTPCAGEIEVRPIAPAEGTLWTDTSVRGWTHDHPEYLPFFQEFGSIGAFEDPSRICFLAFINGAPGAAGTLCLHQGVALLGGASTVPELRRRGLQSALMQARLRYAAANGCDIAMIVTQPGSDSQRNAERCGFHIAYTRTKWDLPNPLPA